MPNPAALPTADYKTPALDNLHVMGIMRVSEYGLPFHRAVVRPTWSAAYRRQPFHCLTVEGLCFLAR